MNAVPDTHSLRHVIVVGGTVAAWRALSDEQWAQRLQELGKVADHVGASWLTLRPYEGDPGSGADASLHRSQVVGDCVVTVDPTADGRERVAAAVATLAAGGSDITETAIDHLLNAPAEADPDLVVILGPPHRLPPSLVWELAYSELVFIDAEWPSLCASHLDEAVSSYAHRNRRFGGVDD